MNVRLVQEFRFEAAHRLPKVPPSHRCSNLHGHSYKIEVAVRGPIDEATGWLMDYADMEAVCAPHIALLDHHYLNEIEGLENPTSEVLSRWLWTRLAPGLPSLERITVWETPDTRCEYGRAT